MTTDGYVKIDYTVSSIRVGNRHRHEMGNVDELAESIARVGLLQPITITPDGYLICGARRLAAVQLLGWEHVKVWVRSGLSNQLQLLLAEREENIRRKAYTPSESVALYRELKELMAEDAARRQEASRFGAEGGPTEHGDAKLAAPSDRTTRAQAAQLVTGRKSHTTLDRADELERIVEDEAEPEEIRELARTEKAAMNADGKVFGHYRTVKAAQAAAETMAEPRGRPGRHEVRAFLLGLSELRTWAAKYDPGRIGPGLSEDQWADVEQTVRDAGSFVEQARQARGSEKQGDVDVPDS